VKEYICWHPDLRAKIVVSPLIELFLWWELIGLLVDSSPIQVVPTDRELEKPQGVVPEL
jgi:hypothetical protein